MERGYLEIPTDFFDHEIIKHLESLDGGDSMISLWLHMLTKFKPLVGRERYFDWPYTELTYKDVGTFFDEDESVVEAAFLEYERLGIARFGAHQISLRVFWEEKKPRVATPETAIWRERVLMRDGFSCKMCGAKEDLQAHHIIAWQQTGEGDPLRIDVSNGITLCRKCHLIAHNGCWKNVCSKEEEMFLRGLIEARGE